MAVTTLTEVQRDKNARDKVRQGREEERGAEETGGRKHKNVHTYVQYVWVYGPERISQHFLKATA